MRDFKKYFLILFLVGLQACFGALPTVLFNSGTGSDTAASGAGPGTALSGANAATTAAANTVDLSADAPDLSGVATDGSAVIYVNSSSGRKFSKITNVNNGTKVVTCQDNYANTEGSRGWGIGGKRATLAASLTLGVDAYEGWTVQFEDDGSLAISAAYVWGPTLSAADGHLKVQGDSASTLRLCVQSANAANFSFTTTQANIDVSNIQFTCSNGTRTSANGMSSAVGGTVNVRNCVFGDSTNKLNVACARTSAAPVINFFDCEFKNLITGHSNASAVISTLVGCWAHNGTSHGFLTGSQITLINCIGSSNGGDGFHANNSSTPRAVIGCTFYGNTGDGMETGTGLTTGVFCNNIFANNTGVGWLAAANTDNPIYFNDFNDYYSNSGGTRTNVSAGPNDLTLDPQFTNAGSNDFSIGTNLKAAGFPSSARFFGANKSATTTYMDMGSVQRQEASSAGNVFIHTE